MIKKMVLTATALSLALVLSIAAVIPVMADTPFQGYNFNHWGMLVPSPAAYVPVRSFTMTDIDPELGDMTEPTDLHVDNLNRIHIVDAGNNRIVVIDSNLDLLRVLDGFYRDGVWETFSRPHGVFVTDDLQIFIADNGNQRVVVLDENDAFVREITAPDIDDLGDAFLFRPLHVLVDRGGRTFVIVQGVFEGIMSFNAEGEFLGYFGTIEVSVNPIDLVWRFFMTQAQRAVQNRFIPRQFQSMDIDEYGFVFTTHVETWHANNQIMRLNPRGEDVLVNFNDNVAINGDQGFRPTGALSGPSVLVDVVARPNGMYSALCAVRGRIYTYDSEGNLLYVFSGTGSLQGMTRSPVSVEVLGDDIFVLDSHGRGRIIHFEPTEYGRLINEAIALRYIGNERGAVDAWRRLVAIDENFALAWSGIGRAFLADGDNVSAMYYLRRGMDVRYFSVAFRRNRLDVMQDTLPTALSGAAIVAGLFVLFKIIRRIARWKGALPT